jgi:hypothetical protein
VPEPPRVEGGGPTDDAVHLVSLPQQELDEVGPVLAGDAGDKRLRHDLSSKLLKTRDVLKLFNPPDQEFISIIKKFKNVPNFSAF